MDLVLKGGALIYTQVTSAARVAALFPSYLLLNAAAQHQSTAAAEAGITYYTGKVTHARRRPVENSFEYQVRMALVDLQQPPGWFQQQQAQDHLSADAARAFAQTEGQVLLLTTPKVAGYTQNPISVYFCYGAAGRLLKAIAEVTNTPWGERVTFAFNPAGDTSPKALHVSPFMDMDNVWHLKASDPTTSSLLTVSVLVKHPKLGSYFDAHLLLERCEANDNHPAERSGIGNLFRYGFMPHRVALWIYWQAAKLIAKGCPVYTKPSNAFRAHVTAITNIKGSGMGQPYVWRESQEWPWYL